MYQPLEILDATSKRARLDLVVPLLYPGVRAHRSVDPLEVLASLIIFVVLLLAPMEIYVALVTVSSLVLIREPRIVRCGLPRFLSDVRKLRHDCDDIGHCLTSHKLFNL